MSSQLVLDVNRVFHDLEGQDYDDKHAEIFVDEVERWRRIGQQLLSNPVGPRRILDVGSGTGFVASQWAPFLGSYDRFVLSDLSERKLACCRKAFPKDGHVCQFDFVQVDGGAYPFHSGEFSFVTMNSVLHHVPDFESFLTELDRMLAPGGFLVVGHEPNRRFYQHKVLSRYAALNWIFLRPSQGVVGLVKRLGIDRALRMLGIRERIRRTYLRMRGQGLAEQVREQEDLLDAVNRELLDQGAIEKPLSRAEITSLVDYHSPTAGESIDSDRGIDIEELQQWYLPGYTFESHTTYNHLGEPTYGKRWAKSVDARLARRYPKDGASLFVVLRKPQA